MPPFLFLFCFQKKLKSYICYEFYVLSKLSSLRKISRLLMPVFLVVVFCYVANATLNQHYHKLSSGIIMSHAHPYHNNNDAGVPFKNHSHSSAEFIFLDQISTTVFWIYLFIVLLIPSLFIFNTPLVPVVIFIRKRFLYFLRNYHAPPFHY
jgi:hypothetical protein